MDKIISHTLVDRDIGIYIMPLLKLEKLALSSLALCLLLCTWRIKDHLAWRNGQMWIKNLRIFLLLINLLKLEWENIPCNVQKLYDNFRYKLVLMGKRHNQVVYKLTNDKNCTPQTFCNILRSRSTQSKARANDHLYGFSEPCARHEDIFRCSIGPRSWCLRLGRYL